MDSPDPSLPGMDTAVALQDVEKTSQSQNQPPKRKDPHPPKYQRSCDYCRYRKVKCTKVDGSQTCLHCQSCGVTCHFSLKQKSQKRRLKSARIAASITKPSETTGLHSFLPDPVFGGASRSPDPPNHFRQNSAPTPTSSANVSTTQVCTGRSLSQTTGSPGSGSIPGMSPKDGSSVGLSSLAVEKYNSNGIGGSPASMAANGGIEMVAGMINPSANPKKTIKSSKDIYTQFVQPFTPFLPDYLTLDDDKKLPSLMKCCISLSALTSADYWTPDATSEFLLEVCNDLLQKEREWETNTIASVFLLAARCKLPQGVLARAMEAFRDQYTRLDGRVDSKIILGAIAVETWNALVDKRPPALDRGILSNFDLYLKELDDDTFGYYFMVLTEILLKVLFSFSETAAAAPESGSPYYSWCSQKYRFMKLESDLLMWPVKLPKHLTVVKDELIAPNEAVILHVMHNTVMLTLYDYALKHPDTYGRQLAVLPVPGLLQFMTGMAKSTFKCGGHMKHRWPLLRQCQVITASYMLDLYSFTEYEFCKRALAWWVDGEIDPVLFQKAKELLDGKDWTEHSDGAIVFWVFRDVRSMSLDMIMADARDRGELPW